MATRQVHERAATWLAAGAAMTGTRQSLGRLGETAVAAYLQRLGWQVVERNYRCRLGEIDLVARDGCTLVFVEVRTRASDSFGSPEESITVAKKAKMTAAALTYLAERGEPQGDWRIDFFAVRVTAGRISRMEHYRHAIQ